MKSFHCMSHLPEVFASRDREKASYIAGVLVIRGPSYAKFFCLNGVSKFKGPRKSVLHSGRPSYPVYHLSRVYCNAKNGHFSQKMAKMAETYQSAYLEN